MTEEEARAWLASHDVSHETFERLEKFVGHLTAESRNQNLIAASTIEDMWTRHIVDSAQLVPLAPPGSWADLGSGAGLPGLVIAALGRPVTMIESRTKRVQFLRDSATLMGLASSVTVIHARVETVEPQAFSVITARAFAPLPRLLAVAHHLSSPATTWILPKGRSAADELAEVRGSWQGDFRIVPSVTDPEAAIIVAREVRPREA